MEVWGVPWVWGAVAVLAVAGAAGLVLTVVGVRRARRRESAEAAEQRVAVRRAAQEDVAAFGEELRRLGHRVAGPGLDADDRADYQHAIDALRTARESVATVGDPVDVQPITELVEDGRRALARVQVRIEDQTPPPRRPPCFFDPRHGPSATDVSWQPFGGRPRLVPACCRDAERVANGGEPDSRRVRIGQRRVPYWQAGAAFGPWVTGYFGSYDVLPALLAGTTLGGALFGSEYGYLRGHRRRGRWWLVRGRSGGGVGAGGI